MSLQDLQKMQQQLHLLHKEKTSLQDQNSQQRVQIQQLTARVTELEIIVDNNPIRFTVQRFDPQIENNYNRTLDQKLRGMTMENIALKSMIDDHRHLLTAEQQRTAQLQQSYEDALNQIEQQKINMRSLKALLQRSQKQVSNERARFKKSNEELQRTIKQKSQLSEQLKQEQGKNHNLLLDLARRATSMRPQNASQAIKHLNVEADLQTLRSLTEIQQSQLQERNQQIAHLKVINGSPYDLQQENMKNTIQHLRVEVSRYTNLIKTVNQKLAFAEEVIKKYSTAAENFKEQMATLGKMSELLQEKQATIKTLKKKIEQNDMKVAREMKQMNDLKAQTVEIIKENSALQFYLFQLLGQNDKNLIDGIKEDYETRQRDRKNREKWSTVQELVTVNLRLRQRLVGKA